ncbi:replication initiator protein A [Cetobacterium sp. SF1]|uniref:replication initiator protein A n=1 Tax=Cetobacterium sp. SF1 TaxID=3417654 RepID=UPI003CEBDB1D
MKKLKGVNIPLNERIDTGPSEIVEKFLDVSEIENEKSNSLVRIDINVIEYPLFTKSTSKKKNQIIRYFFNRSKEAYIQVNPTAGDYIPGEFEERVFIAILKIMRDKRYSNIFYTTVSEILTNMGIPQETFRGFYSRISKALVRLSQTSYTFKNSLYSNKIKGIIEEQVNTNIMNIRSISIKQATNDELNQFKDRRVKEVIKVSISDHFYDNIIRKGYLVYDSQLLLSMENPITRALYMLINKLRFDRLYLKVLSMNLIKRIPLSENIQKIGRTIKVLEKSCEELKKMDLIEHYKIIKNSKWIESEIEFYFDKRHNNLKQSYFFDDKNHFDNLLITHTDGGAQLVNDGNRHFETVKLETLDKIPTDEKVKLILEIMPGKARELKTLPKAIKDAIRHYGFEYIKLVAQYMSKKNVSNIRSYFLQTLEKGWAEEYILQNKKINTAEVAKSEIEVGELVKDTKDEVIINDYLLSLTTEQRIILEEQVYKDYIKECGMEGKIQKMAFSAAKESLIKKYVEKNIDVLKIEFNTAEVAKNENIVEKSKNETILISKIYKNMSMFQLDILELLEGYDAKEVNKIIRLVNITKYFEGEIENHHIEIEYIDNEESKIKLEKRD